VWSPHVRSPHVRGPWNTNEIVDLENGPQVAILRDEIKTYRQGHSISTVWKLLGQHMAAWVSSVSKKHWAPLDSTI
jgi:hypothetical protein